MLFTYVHLPATFRRIAVFLVIFGLLALLPVMPISAQTCSGAFIEHLLPHTTQSRGSTVRFYESNGSGLAINDLNGDGLLDLVLGNLDGSNRILWNEGDLTFRAQEFPRPTGSRAD